MYIHEYRMLVIELCVIPNAHLKWNLFNIVVFKLQVE